VFVWLDATNRIVGFKICYDRHDADMAVTWREDDGWEHSPVADHEETSLYGVSEYAILLDLPPIMIPFPLLLREWQTRSPQIDAEIAAIIEARLHAAVTYDR
jgi:hypothetical protein